MQAEQKTYLIHTDHSVVLWQFAFATVFRSIRGKYWSLPRWKALVLTAWLVGRRECPLSPRDVCRESIPFLSKT